MLNIAEVRTDFYSPVDQYKITGTLAYIDTLALFCRQLPAYIRKDLERAVGKRIRIKQVFRGYLIFLHQPTTKTLDTLANKQRETANSYYYRLTMSRLDLAVDFLTTEREYANELQYHLERHLKLLYSREMGTVEYGDTVYWKRRGRQRNLTAYTEQAARMGGDTQEPCFHLELRLRKQAIEKLDLQTINSLYTLNPREVFQRMVRYVSFTEQEETKRRERYIRKESKRKADRYQNREDAERRLRGFLDRFSIILSHQLPHRKRDGKQDWLTSLVPGFMSIPGIVIIKEFSERGNFGYLYNGGEGSGLASVLYAG